MPTTTRSKTHPLVRYVEITPEIVNRAVYKDSHRCMIAEAIKEQYPYVTNVTIDAAFIRYTIPERGQRFIHITPSIAATLLVKFDQALAIEPVTFRLTSPVQIVDTAKRNAERRERERKQIERGEIPAKRSKIRKNSGQGTALTKLGGKTPPSGPLSNSRGLPNNIRTYGLCSLTRAVNDATKEN